MTAIPNTSRALVLAPRGRDAFVACDMLKEAGLESVVCADFAQFEGAIGDDTALAVLTEEVLRYADLRALIAWVKEQPSWSDLPFIILTQRAGGRPEQNPAPGRMAEALGNVTFLERPFHVTSFISVVRTAFRGRQRQYEARTRIEELGESEGRLRTALLAGRLGSWDLDLSNWALATSATCKALFGRAADQPFTYQDMIASVHPEDHDAMRHSVSKSILTNSDYAIECRTIWPDGSVHWAEISARLVRDSQSARARLVGVTSDITARKTAEQHMRRLNETLEERVAERTAENARAHEMVLEEIRQREAAEELLRQAQKMEMIGQLTGGVAHDFNNLLMAVIGNLDLLRRHIPDDPKTMRFVDGALQGAQRGAALTQRLLAFARRQDLKPKPHNLSELVADMGGLLERSVGSQVELHRDLPANLPLALLDSNQIELALLNLVVNARDAMPDGGVISIKVDVAYSAGTVELPAGKYVRLSVSDTGHGMNAMTLQKATEPFFSTKELGKGTGLGLSMIHGLAIQLNGSLKLFSEVGRGTRAELWLPSTDQAPEATAESPAVTELPAEAPKVTILVVDDDVLISMSTVDMLEDLGHEVIEVNSGADALEILAKDNAVDLLITDYSMPQMNGAQLAVAARDLRPDLPILLATGYADLPAGVDINLPRLAKPYQQSQLAAEVAKMVRGRLNATRG